MSVPEDRDPTPLIRATGITMRYPGVERAVLDDVSVTMRDSETLAIVGPSGSGKSTLLNVIGVLTPPTAGVVEFDGSPLRGLSDDEASTFRNQHIGFVFQSHHLLPQCTALENVLIPSLVHPDSQIRATAPDRARELLTLVGLDDRMTHRPGQLSGGECQRVAVARALINKPHLLLADEPTGSLDEETASQLVDLLTSLNRDHGLSLIMVTHAAELAGRLDHVLTLRQGRLEPHA